MAEPEKKTNSLVLKSFGIVITKISRKDHTENFSFTDYHLLISIHSFDLTQHSWKKTPST